MRRGWVILSGLFSALALQDVIAFNAPPDIPTWCGKPYMSSSPSFDPGGQFQFPTPQTTPLLYITIQPRYSIFLEADVIGSFLIDASISYLFGQPYNNVTGVPGKFSPETSTLDFDMFFEEKKLLSASVPINSTNNIVEFLLTDFDPRYEPYQVVLSGVSGNETHTFSATTYIYILPSRSYGSAVKIDNLHGGLYVQNADNNWDGWYPIFPNGGYADGGHVTPSNITFENLDTYAAHGFNTINIVPDGGRPDQAYPIDELGAYWDHMDEVNLFNVYDLRFAYQNSTRINEQVEMWKNRTTLIMWYTADEPDGWVHPLNATKLAYEQIRKLDPYHPVSLVLNCQNFYYEEYASGGDIIFEDAYPVAINATWSIPWNTPCNTTYGDCGCDNCIGELGDVASRLDLLQIYQANLENQHSKPTWAVVQTFGEQDYWPNIPTAAEVVNMMMLSINHNAKGLTYWIYPSTDEVNIESGKFGNIFQSLPGRDYVFGTNVIKNLVVEGPKLDASAWILGGKMMVGIASSSYEGYDAAINITLPVTAKSVDEVLYGETPGWTVDGNRLSKQGLTSLEVSVLVLNVST